MTSGPSSTSGPPTTPARPRPTRTRRPSMDAGGWRRTPPDGIRPGGCRTRWDGISVERCQELAEPATVAEILAELAEARSSWSRAEVAKAIARRLPPGLGTSAEAGREWIEATTAAVLAHPEVVTLSSPPSAEVPLGLRRQDGLPGHERHGAPRHTTRLTLAREGRVLDALVRGRHAAVAIVVPEAAESAAQRHRLGDDQTAALRRICQGGERLTCVVGPAGAGKTRLVRAARDAWAADGTAVRGLAVSA